MTRRSALGRTLRAALAFVLTAAVLPPSAAASAYVPPPRYEHLWRAETMLGGDRGATVKAVRRSEVALTRTGDAIEGTVFYGDRLGMRDSSGISSQASSIELALTGAFVQAGGTIGGTFEGEATLLRQTASSLQEAISPGIELRSDGIQGVYAVSGHWGAKIAEDGRVSGEILYERAELMRSSVAEATPANVEWFDRAGATAPGEPQTFTAVLGGEPFVPSDGGDGGSDGDAPGGARGGGGSGGGTSVWRYIAAGLRGAPIDRLAPASGDAARAARALRDARPLGATPLPSSALAIDIDVAGTYLDALNRASMLTVDEGLAGFEPLADAWTRARAASPPVGVPVGDRAAAQLAAGLAVSLAGQDAPGAEALARQADDVAKSATSASAEEVATWIQVAVAVGGTKPLGDVIADTRGAVQRVREAPLPAGGPEHDAVLAAADSVRAPKSASVLKRFAREPSSDATAPAGPRVIPGSTVAAALRTRLYWPAGSGIASVTPSRLLAYRRGDGRLFWLADPDRRVALTDGRLLGWAFETRRVWLVDPDRVGRVLAEFRPEGPR